jgi:hypothetical protein
MARELSRYERFRREVRDLGIEAERDVAILWRSLDDARGAKDALFDLLPEIVAAYHGAAAAAAADFYDDVREMAGARGRFTAVVLDPPRDMGTDELVKWALGAAKDNSTFQSLIVGGVTRRISNGARNVVTGSSIADPAASGWMRIGGGGCDFCAMLIGRGAVYSEASVDFASHDHCNCGAAPAFNPSQVSAVKSEFVPSARRKSESVKEADRERVRDWIADHL